MRVWFSKLLFLLRYRVARFFAIDPFLRINEHEYCPSCGHRKGAVRAVVLTDADTSGSRIAILHDCAVCRFKWCESSVTVVKEFSAFAADPMTDDEQAAIETMNADKRTKNVRATRKINGELVQ